jgi:hypothetical protein
LELFAVWSDSTVLKRDLASPVRTEKRYLYMTELLKKIVTLRLEDRVGMAQKIVLEPDDPRKLLIIVNCCIRIIYDIVGTVCSLE